MKSGTLAITNIKTEKEHDDKPEVASCTDARETYWDIVSKRIKELGITRRDFCREVGINENALSGMMKKTPNIVFFKKATQVLGIDLSYLFDSTISPSCEEHYNLLEYEKELILELRKEVRSKREERAKGLTLLLKYLRNPSSVGVLEACDVATLPSVTNAKDVAHEMSDDSCESSVFDTEVAKKSVDKANKTKVYKDMEEERQPSLFDGLESEI